MNLLDTLRSYMRRSLGQDAYTAVDQVIVGAGAGDAELCYALLTIHVTNADGAPVRTDDNHFVRA